MLPPGSISLCTSFAASAIRVRVDRRRRQATRLPASAKTGPSPALHRRDARLRAASLRVELHGAGNADHGEVAAAARHFHEAGAGARRRGRQFHFHQHLIRLPARWSARRQKNPPRRSSARRFTDCARNLPPSASTMAGISDAGSACARLPPMVPRLRICGCAICGSASAISGRCGPRRPDRVRGCGSASARRCAAARRPRCSTPASSVSGLMSISIAGCVSRKFIVGTRL